MPITIKGNELVKKILAGERDFNRIALPDGTDLTEYIPELNDYLGNSDLEPLSLINSSLIRIFVPAIYIPHIRLSGADLSKANLNGANLIGANLNGANLSGAILYKTDIIGAKLNGANLDGAEMSGTALYGTDIRGVKKLEKACNLEWALIRDTIVNEVEEAILERVRVNFQLYDLRKE